MRLTWMHKTNLLIQHLITCKLKTWFYGRMARDAHGLLKVSTGLIISYPSMPYGRHPLKWPYSRLGVAHPQGGWPVTIFYPFRLPTPDAYVWFSQSKTWLKPDWIRLILLLTPTILGWLHCDTKVSKIGLILDTISKALPSPNHSTSRGRPFLEQPNVLMAVTRIAACNINFWMTLSCVLLVWIIPAAKARDRKISSYAGLKEELSRVGIVVCMR
jgi:hypothetical protein